MAFREIAELVVLFYMASVWGAEFMADMRFYGASGFDLTRQRDAHIFNGIIVRTLGVPATAKFRFYFLYPLMMVFGLVLLLDVLGKL
jgi:hypothetical protein